MLPFLNASLALRLVFGVLAVQAIFTGAVVFDLVHREREVIEANRAERAQGLAEMLAASGVDRVAAGDPASLAGLVQSAQRMKSVRYAVYVDPAGRVLARSSGIPQTDLTAMQAHARRAFGGQARIFQSGSFIDSAAPVTSGGHLIGWAIVRVSVEDAAGLERELASWGIGYASLAMLLGLLVSLLVTRGVTRQLEELSSVSRKFRLGDHDVRATGMGADEVGQVARGINQMLDVIVASERFLSETQRAAKLGTWQYDPATGQSDWSDMTFELFGFDPAAGVPSLEDIARTMSDEDARRMRDNLDPAKAPTLAGIEITVRRPDGEQWVCWLEIRSRRTLEGGTVFYGSCQDKTDRAAAAAQLRQSQKMEAVGQLTGGIAHDFNNLLAIVIGNLDFLRDELTERSQQESVDEALGAALRGAELTRQLLAFSRRQPLSAELIEGNELISAAITLWRRTLGPDVKIKARLNKDLWITRADPTQLEAALLNLVINARDAMPRGGTVTIETSNLSLTEPMPSEIGDEKLPAGDYVTIAVADSGIGMSPEVLARAIEPFFTTKPTGKGTGLGLSMIYGFAKQSGGQVWIDSEPERGTCVTILLPRASDLLERVQANASARGSGPDTVLLVDDDPGVLQVAGRQLRELGYRVIPAESGSEALAKLNRNPDIRLLITDIMMPGGMNGFELSERALELRPHLKVLHASGFSPGAGLEASDDSPTPILTKPFRKADLAAKLDVVLDGPQTKDV